MIDLTQLLGLSTFRKIYSEVLNKQRSHNT